MNKLNGEAIIVHGGGLTPDEQLTLKARQRMDTAVCAWQNDAAPNMVTSGGHSFMLQTPPSVSEAEVMKRYAVDLGVPDEVIETEDKSLDTIGNALFTKTEIVVPSEWEDLIVVTSESHLPRALRIFKHVFGPDYNIQGLSAPENVTIKEKLYEKVGLAMLDEVLRGTKPGDDEAIKESLFELVPGYAEGTIKNLAIKSLTGLVKPK